MDVFSDDNPDLMALEIVREFDNLIKKFYCINGRTSCGAIMAMTIATHFSINRLTLLAKFQTPPHGIASDIVGPKS